MQLRQRISAHLVDTISATPLARAPFDHLVFTEPFPRELYPRLLAALPADAYYRELKHSDAMLADGRSARLQFPLDAANISRLPAAERTFWTEVSAALRSPAIDAAYRRKFGEVLESVARRPLAQVRLRHYPTLFRDLGGYRISIHPDSPRKAISSQFYLPTDDSQLHLGTRLHARTADGSFDAGNALRFAPNSGYAFAVTPESWHSVDPMRADDRPRNSLMVIVFYDRGPLIEGFKTARAYARALYERALRSGGARAEHGEGTYERM